MGWGAMFSRGEAKSVDPVRAGAVMAERLLHLKRQMPLVLGGSILVAPLVATTLAHATGSRFASTWCVAVITVSIARWLWVTRQRMATDPAAQRRQVIGHMAGAAAAGALWGLLAQAALSANSSLAAVHTFMFLSGMVAGGIGSLSTIPLAHASFALPAFLPMIGYFALSHDPAENVYGIAAVIFLGVSLTYSVNFSHILIRTIELRFDKETLIVSLEEARARAERESEMKSRFLQSASHDLRQPLHAVTLLLADLASLLPARGLPKLRQSQASVMSLAQLLDRLLEASRVGSGDLKPNIGPIALQPLLEALAFEYGPEARKSGLSLAIVPTSLAVSCDDLMLMQILRNYLSNALRHARGKVVLGARRRGDAVRIEVWDDGPGIAEAHFQTIFEAFYQIGNPARDPARGYGLGLAIVASMARLLGIDHGVRSVPDRGTAFHVDLRRSAAPPPRPPEPDDDGAAPDRRSGHVLIIEDNAELRTITADYVRRWGYRVAEAVDGAGALAMIRTGFVPHAVITDFQLPGEMNGLEAASAIGGLLGHSLPVAIVTGNPTGVPDGTGPLIAVLKKPLLPGRLKAWLAAHLTVAGS